MTDRLDTLERIVADLAREMGELRAVVERLEADRRPSHRVSTDGRTEPMRVPDPLAIAPEAEIPAVISLGGGVYSEASAPSAPAASASMATEPRRRAYDRRSGLGRRTIDFESLIGRYGTLALASLTILLGVGAFLGWAIQQGKIGPGMRVFLGALAAGALAVVGWRLRARSSVRFGSVLLALSLALVHVDAWGAGPYLRLVPSPVALAIAAAASVALAALAWRWDEEALFSVGVGGALIAPFVTSSESSSVPALLLYGYIVLASGLAALKGRAWRTAATVSALGGWLYTAAAVASLGSGAATLARDLPAVFALAVAWTALLLAREPWGGRVARSGLVALAGALIAQVPDRAPAMDLVLLAALGTVSAYAVVQAGEASRRWLLFTAAVLPITLGAVAVASVRDAPSARVLVAVGWTAVAAFAAIAQPGVRGTHTMVAALTSAAALLFALENRPVASCVALFAHAAGFSLLLRRERRRAIGVPIGFDLVVATPWTFGLLSERMAYDYTPFLTRASLAGLVMAAAWFVVSWNASRVEYDDGKGGRLETRTMLRLAGAVVTFLWGHVELARAYSRDMSTFLLIFYYATVGVAAIFIGRRRNIGALRNVGLALAILAALKAIGEASSLGIGIRVGSYLLAGLYLLAVAYWYRDQALASES